MSCDEIVDMMAASTAASTTPATNGWNRTCARRRNTVSGLSSVTPSRKKYARPAKPVVIAPMAVRIIQLMPIRRPALASAADRMAMNRTMMCG